MKIGDIKTEEFPLLLAPMEDITDPSFRQICKEFGADIVYTEFISSDGLIRDGKKSLKKLDFDESERPLGIQLYGHLIESMTNAAEMALKASPNLIDINFGCPVKKIANRGAGAGMLRNIALMIEMTKAIVDVSTVPVTVKTRLGWDEESKNIIDIALKLQETGIKALTVHGRTRNQLYKGSADWTLIGELKNHPDIEIPIIGNGDITNATEAKQHFEKYRVDGIMIGRAAVGKPWIFRDIKHFMKTGEILPEPNLTERVELAKRHFQKSLDWKEDKVGIYEMRRHFSNYFKGLPHFKETRLKLLTSMDIEEIRDILEAIKIKYSDFDFSDPQNFRIAD